MENLENGWELNRKHIFILSASGKPIYSRYGDEQEMVTTFGLLQAVISIVMDSGDVLKVIKSGSRRIIYLIKNSIYLISVSSTEEPEVVIVKQLEFLYNQILLMLTSKAQLILKNNPSADLRQLLGTDTTRIMNSVCENDITPNFIAFNAVKSFTCQKELRDEISFQFKYCVEISGAA
jgi:hypothetical protein